MIFESIRVNKKKVGTVCTHLEKGLGKVINSYMLKKFFLISIFDPIAQSSKLTTKMPPNAPNSSENGFNAQAGLFFYKKMIVKYGKLCKEQFLKRSPHFPAPFF
jgi:hypothetical protein